jgi:diacylglycerol kinase (ATP)
MFGLAEALGNSVRGLAHALRSERALQQEAAALLAAAPLALVLGTSAFQRAILIACVLGVLAVELLNTCIEKLCDHVTPNLNPHIRAVKDMGSAAVFCAILGCALCWGAALAERLGF